MKEKQYIGDGVYVQFDGYSIWLTTEDGINVQNRICIEPYVWEALERYVKELKKGTRS